MQNNLEPVPTGKGKVTPLSQQKPDTHGAAGKVRYPVFIILACVLFFGNCSEDKESVDTGKTPPAQNSEQANAEPSTYRNEPFLVALELSTEVRAGKLMVRGKTNLPTGTQISMGWYSDNDTDRIGGHGDLTVKDGAFESGALSNQGAVIPAGSYTVHLSMIPGAQPVAVQSILGKAGNNLTGPNVETGGANNKYISVDRSVTISGPESVAARQASDGKLESYRSELKNLLRELDEFKNQDDFLRFGLAPAGRVEWLHKVESLGKRAPSGLPYSFTVSLRQLAEAYRSSRGQENDETRRCRDELAKFFESATK